MARRYLTGFWRGKLLDELLWESTDGYMARFYTADLLADAFDTFFESVSVQSLGQETDAVPLPRYFRRSIVRLIPEETLARWANRRGAFLFITARKGG